MNAREVALAVVRDVFGAPGRGAREAFAYRIRRAGLDERDRAFAMELAFGAIRMRRLLDWYLAPFIGERGATLPPTIREVLRLGTHQLVRMRVEPRAAVHETVALALRYGHRGTAGLVNAVLRRVAELGALVPEPAAFATEDEYLATAASLPTWIVAQWRARFGAEQLPSILAGVDAPASTAVTVDPRRITPDEAVALLAERGIAAAPSAFVPQSIVLTGSPGTAVLEALGGDRWWIQGESAAMPVDLLAPQPGERVIEFAAGRGNKSRQIVSRAGGAVRLEAVELDPRRAAQLRERLGAMGATQAAVVEGDATAIPADAAWSGADAVLVDAPCSGLGIVGRQPEARWRKRPEDGARLADIQRAMLGAAAARVRPGGRIVYAVCSTDPREGEAVLEAVLGGEPALARMPVPARYAPFVTPPGDVLVPPGIDGRDGFFIAQLRRCG